MLPNNFCPVTGEKLIIKSVYQGGFIRLLESSVGKYLEVNDIAYGALPLQQLQKGVAEALESATLDELNLALSRLKRIDYRTISILAFEYTLLKCYSEYYDYDIVYHQTADA